MSHDIIADTLNEIMNAKRSRKNEIVVKRHSKLLLSLLEVAKRYGYIEEFKVKGRDLSIKFNLNECKAVKPRFDVQIKDIDKYIRRYLPSRNFGIIIISTSAGLIVQDEMIEKNIGGCLLAYFY
jgi:ribosomal protein S8